MGELIHSKVEKKYGGYTICLYIRGDENDGYSSMSLKWEDCDTIGEVFEEMIKQSDGTSEIDKSLINKIIKEQKIEKEAFEKAYA